MRFDYLDEFIALAKRRNFTAAARDLRISQSTLSKHMSSLAQDLDLHLLETVPQVRLTPSGNEFLKYAERIVRLRDTAIAECRKIEAGLKGALYVEDPIVLTALTSKLHEMLEEFSADNPDISTSIRATESLTTLENVDSGVFDIAQGLYREKDLDSAVVEGRDFQLIPFMEDEVVLWVPREHPLASKPDLRFCDLDGIEVSLPGAMVWTKWRDLLAQMAREFGFGLVISLSITDSIHEYWSASPESRVFLLVNQITSEQRVASRSDMVVRRFEHDDTSFMFYLMFDAHSKNPAVAQFEDWYATRAS